MRVKFTLSIGFPAAKHSEIKEVDPNATVADLDQAWLEWANNFIDGGFEILEPWGAE